ncbi:MAG: prepilin peptidase [Candidatus Pacebacteria bacterium]|nr:prepilin peptidase [Candidatus Paceibacterota bacterium]
MNLILFQVSIFVFGLIIGSFLNVVILRYGKKSLNGRSECISCKKKLYWYELIPVFSFIFQKARCRKCKKKISWQYPTIEIITGLLFLLIFNHQFFTPMGKPLLEGQFFTGVAILGLFYYWIIFSLLIVIFVYDLYHKIIPDLLVFTFVGLTFIKIIINFDGFYFLSDLWAGPILALPFAFLWVISKGRWLGLGDAKLILGIGWLLGLIKGSSAIVLGVWIGTMAGLFLIFLPRFLKQYSFFNKLRLFFGLKNFTIKSELPFAPFLIIGTIIVFFLGWDVWGLSLVL